MKKFFVFTFILAMFIALTGGYGQVLNSDWVTRSFTSAAEQSNSYPELEIGARYQIYFDSENRIYDIHNSFLIILEQQGGWVKIKKGGDTYPGYDNHYTAWINLDNVTSIRWLPET